MSDTSGKCGIKAMHTLWLELRLNEVFSSKTKIYMKKISTEKQSHTSKAIHYSSQILYFI